MELSYKKLLVLIRDVPRISRITRLLLTVSAKTKIHVHVQNIPKSNRNPETSEIKIH